ncbi:HEAT repeat domain-containing protein [Streptomyces sp. NPDC002580]|uniref:HEAT repeat domain-containing protein n=1 Tax=Streptomyces sp. NPDC002580 TaxID=3364653 RepID=UPI0036C7EFE0
MILLVSVIEVVVCLLVLCVSRLVRNRREHVRREAAAATRPLVLRVTAGEDTSADAALAALDKHSWRATQPTVLRLLGSVKGGSHSSLTDILLRRGVVDQALADGARPHGLRRAHAASLLALTGDALKADPLRGPAARTTLHALLTDRNATVREAAVRALGRVGDADSARLLLAALRSPLAVAPGLTGDALIRIGPAAVPALIEAVHATGGQQRALAVELLGLIRDRRAVATLSAALDDDSAAVRASAAAALGRVAEPAAVPALIHSVRADPSARVAVAAAEALGLIGDQSAIPVLREALTAQGYRLAHTAAHALLRLGPTGRGALTDSTLAPGAAAHAHEVLATAQVMAGGGR